MEEKNITITTLENQVKLLKNILDRVQTYIELNQKSTEDALQKLHNFYENEYIDEEEYDKAHMNRLLIILLLFIVEVLFAGFIPRTLIISYAIGGFSSTFSLSILSLIYKNHKIKKQDKKLEKREKGISNLIKDMEEAENLEEEIKNVISIYENKIEKNDRDELELYYNEVVKLIQETQNINIVYTDNLASDKKNGLMKVIGSRRKGSKNKTLRLPSTIK